MNAIKLYHLLIVALLLPLCSCVDEPFYVEHGRDFDEAETEISASISFQSFAPALEHTRASGGAPGTAISDINTLYILIYEDTGNEIEVTNPDGSITLQKEWKLEPGGRIMLNATDHALKITNPGNDRPDKDSQEETRTANATFRLRHKTGKFKIYAVANVDLSPDSVPDKDIDTPEKLKGLNLRWHEGAENVGKNNGMFGCFTNTVITPDETVTVSPNQTLHAWLRRAASKVTIAYDGSALFDGVEVYILAASIKDIPIMCPLGKKNEPDKAELLFKEGGAIKYYMDNVTAPDPNVLQIGLYDAYVTNKRQNYGSRHTVSDEALFFYENMQGEGKSKKQTAPGPGNNQGQDNGIGFPNPDKDTPGTGWKDDKPFGTYIEVDAYYRSNNRNRPGSGIIKYRFMLGKDTDKNYDAERNSHYKLTLRFKGYANDCDWHIDYDPGEVFEVSQPKVFNYAGKVFMPDYYWPNGMHEFVPENPIAVTSFVGNVDDPKIGFKPVKVDISYPDGGPAWLDTVSQPGLVPYQKNLVFSVKPKALEEDGKYVRRFNINTLLANAEGKGTVDNPINLADLSRRPINSNAKITCTANCYMVDAPGWYILPLVYGNAIHNGAVTTAAFKPYDANVRDDVLPVFRNYRNEPIKNAYIQKDLGISGVTPFLVWQDVDGLVEYNSWWAPNSQIIYVPNAFYDVNGNKTVGGVKFHVAKGTQGNSVIAISETSPEGGAILPNLPPACWSWHIWVTCLDKQLEADDRTIKVQGHDPKRSFDFMPVNLGWCSDEDVIYYKERRCIVKFTFTGNDGQSKTETREIVKKSHIALSRGYNPYYQWGRKDPFTPAWSAMNETPVNGKNYNKELWVSAGWSWGIQNLKPLSDTQDHQAGIFKDTYDTRDALGLLISYPYAWHNPPCVKGPAGGYDYVSINKTYVNLWEGRPGVDPNAPILKTVYDPCPVGYQVPHINAFSGFTTTGLDTSDKREWYDATASNILNYRPNDFGGGIYYYESYEFYTNPDKTQSIIFPINGYRDWNGSGPILHYGLIGYTWAAGNSTQDDSNFFNFMYARDDKGVLGLNIDNAYIRPRNAFYSCDGFGVRPVRNGDHGTSE